MDSRISIIIPTYQHATTIARCLESILVQTRRADEIVVVNDGSTDATSDVLNGFRERILVIDQENMGGNVARNVGFRASSGDLVLFCDADLIMRPNMLERLEKALVAHPEASFAYGGFRFGWKRFRSFPFSAELLRRMNYIHTSSLVRRDRFPGFDPAIRRFQDWDVWLTMSEQGRTGVFVDAELFRVIDRLDRPAISQWRPSWVYRIPWNRLGWRPESVKSYEAARGVIMRKHGL